MPSQKDITQLLADLSNGDKAAQDELYERVYDELCRFASARLHQERAGHTFQTADLVHEAFFKLVGQQNVHWQNRRHFFRIAAQAMRRILVDHARQHQAAKRGGGQPKISLEEATDVAEQRPEEVVAVHEALNKLAAFDKQQSDVVELRFFGGHTIEETAEILAISVATVKREWILAKAWLYREMTRHFAV
jgi:RNA polymerase sigma factor (TIGR02999 family)